MYDTSTAPAITSAASTTVNVGRPGTFTVTATGARDGRPGRLVQ
jgi:hypothetical protein